MQTLAPATALAPDSQMSTHMKQRLASLVTGWETGTPLTRSFVFTFNLLGNVLFLFSSHFQERNDCNYLLISPRQKLRFNDICVSESNGGRPSFIPPPLNL
jgi:hypothetical protein